MELVPKPITPVYNVLKNKDIPTLIDIFENNYSTNEIIRKIKKNYLNPQL